MHGLARDLKYAWRGLGRAPAFAAIAIITLALGIGANTAIFSIIHAVLLRPLPYQNPGELVRLYETEDAPGNYPFAGPDFLDWKMQNRSFADMAAFSYGQDINLSGAGQPDHVIGTHAEANFVRRNSPVPTGPWRAVEYPAQVFARESFLDEMAHAAGRDPLDLRLELLQPGDILKLGEAQIDRGRLIAALKLVAEKSNWRGQPTSLPDRYWGRGLACNIYSDDCFIAQVAEVSVGKSAGDIRVHRIVCALDCGRVINPLGLEGQAESGITWGLTATLHGRIDFKNGAAVQENYSDYEVLRIDEAPVFETYFVPSELRPGGFGETAVPPVAPAVANAIFAATGKRIRRLPITPEQLKA